MKSKTILLLAAMAVAFAAVMVWAWISSAPPGPGTPGSETAPVGPAPKIATGPIPAAPAPIEAPATPALPVANADAIRQNAKPADAPPAEPPVTINGYVLQDPMARVALNFVGSDSDATSYWLGAINDPGLPAEERKDLIEDLNEDGLSDPRHPTAQDMPLILARARMIEQLMGSAMDDVNRAALGEAYKDLINLLNGQEPN